MIPAVNEIKNQIPKNKKVAFISGNFNVVHPGHLRLINFAAECADYVVIGLFPDGSRDAFIPQDLRLQGIQALSQVHFSLILPSKVEEFIQYLRPDIVVKGKEHAFLTNVEQPIVEAYGGELLFASGETWFSSLNLLKKELQAHSLKTFNKPISFLNRHVIDNHKLSKIIDQFPDLHVVVLGDLIVDEYIFCTPLGMSQEDPTLVMTPIKRERFLGGSAIVAAHAKSLGAKVDYFTCVGNDPIATYARHTLNTYHVDFHFLIDESRPTTLKQRFRCKGNTLLRISELRQHEISPQLQKELLNKLYCSLTTANLLVFSDFNYGFLPQSLVDAITSFCLAKNIPMVADSQSSSQIGDIGRFKEMLLITPTEREARLAIQDSHSGLIEVADKLRKKAKAKHLLLTLGEEGVLIYSPENGANTFNADELPRFNLEAKDPSGAGDSLFISSSMSLILGASIYESAYLGSIAAACQVSHIGNIPLQPEELKKELLI